MSEAAREFLDGVNTGGKRCVEFLKLLPIAVAVATASALQTRIGKVAFVLLFTLAIGRTVL